MTELIIVFAMLIYFGIELYGWYHSTDQIN